MNQVSPFVGTMGLLLALLSPLPISSATLAIPFLLQQATAQTGKADLSDQRLKPRVTVKVVDENGVFVVSTRVTLDRTETHSQSSCQTDYTGQCEMEALDPGVYRLQAEKEGFYSTILNDLEVSETQELEVTLNHQQEYAETMNVVDSPETIDPQHDFGILDWTLSEE